MNITLNNYEEFLLLYIDGELNTHEMQLVEAFVKNHPTIQAELQSLQDTKLVPEEYCFGNKASLYKKQLPQEITKANYQEKLLLYVDNELTSSEKADVEKFVLHHPSVQQEFTVLKYTKLLPENISCPNKEDLYRKENKRAPIFYIFRAAVAAIFVGFIGLAYLLIAKNENINNGGGVVITKSTIKTDKNNIPLKKDSINSSTPILPQQNNVAKDAVANTKKSKQNQQIRATGVDPNNNTSIPAVQNNALVTNNSTTIVIPKKQDQDIAVNNLAPVISKATIASNPNDPSALINANALVANNLENNNATKTFTQTVYKNLDVENEESNAILVGNMRLNKTKVKNLFNKVGKLFGKSKKAQMEEEEATKKAVTTI